MSPGNHAELLRRISLQEGGLLEICVLDASLRDWQSTLDALEQAGYEMSLATEGEGDKEPVSITPVLFSEGDNVTSTLHVRVGRQLWTTQFYSTSLVDFQGDPLAVTTKADLDDVEKFMVVISRATGKTARFIPESLDPQKTRSYLEVGP